MKRSSIAMLSCLSLGLMLSFQNCSGPGASFTSGSADAASVETPTVTPDVLGLFNFSDVTKIKFSGNAAVPVVGSFGAATTLNLDHLQHSYNASLQITAPLSLTLNCTSAGTLTNYNALEAALKALTFNTVAGSSLPALDFITATLEITLRDGTVKTFSVDTNSNHLVVDHISHIDAKAFKGFTWSLMTTTGCKY